MSFDNTVLITAGEAVRIYREAGYACFPLISGEKIPAVKGWQTCQPGEYVEETLKGNYGINLPETILVVDCDPRNYPKGTNGLDELEKVVGVLPPTYTVQTGGSGKHLYFRKPGNIKTRKELREHEGIDFLSAGCCVVGPGSVVKGNPYFIVQGHPEVLADAPEALLDLLTKPNMVVQPALEASFPIDDPVAIQAYCSYLQTCEEAIEGQNGDATTYKVACRGRDEGLTAQTTLDLMWEHYNPRCVPGWSENELALKVRNAYQYAKSPAGQSAVRIQELREAEIMSDEAIETNDTVILPELRLGQLPIPMAVYIDSVQKLTQAPLGLAAQSVLATVVLAVQGHVDVQLPSGERKPISQNFIGIGKSGERKTSCDYWAQQAIKAWELAQEPGYKEQYSDYKNRHEIWSQSRKALLNKASASEQVPTGLSNKTLGLSDLGTEPQSPIHPRKTFEEPSFEGLIKALEGNDPSVIINPGEGGAFLGGHAMKKDNQLRMLTGLSKLWDGSPIIRDRAGDGHLTLNGKRVSMSLMVQPVVAQELFGNSLATGQGFLARCCVSWPQSTMGSRSFRDPDPYALAHIREFEHQVTSWLNTPYPLVMGTRNQLQPRLITLDPVAKAAYVRFHDHIENHLGRDGLYESIPGEAAKAAEMAARLAVGMSLFSKPSLTQLNGPEMECGIALAQYYVDQALGIQGKFSGRPLKPQHDTLSEWLRHSWKEDFITPSEVNLYGPRSLRGTSDEAKVHLEELVGKGLLSPYGGTAEIKGKKRVRDLYRVIRPKTPLCALPATSQKGLKVGANADDLPKG